MKKAPTREEKAWMSRVAEMGCIICGQPCELHHVNAGGMGMRSSHMEVIGLCPRHHRTGGHGVAVHAGKKTWEANFGTERELLAQTLASLGVS